MVFLPGVLVHEFGLAIGLRHSGTNSVMRAYMYMRATSQDDTNAARAIYFPLDPHQGEQEPKMTRMMLLIPLAAVLLACGLVSGGDDPAEEIVVLTTVTVSGGYPPEEPVALSTVTVSGSYAPPPWAGDSLVEEKIMGSSSIVRATMNSVTSEVLLMHNAYGVVRYGVVLKFNLSVSEYLKGSGPANVVAVWEDGISNETIDEANDRKDVVDAERDTRWDNREAIIFLYYGPHGFSSPLKEQLQRPDHFILAYGGRYGDDHYSLHSESNRVWLPAVVPATGTGDDQEFLLDVPPTSETITLGNLKNRIIAVSAELSRGDGSEEFNECIFWKYVHLRNQRNWPEERGRPYGGWDLDYSLVSGLPAGTVIDRRESGSDQYPDPSRIVLRLDGRDSAMFDTAEGESTISDTDGDGEYDMIEYDELIRLARPLPAGVYGFDLKETWPYFSPCDFVISNEWTVTVTSPPGVLHELMFDPVTVGSAVTADGSNGVLKPAAFTDGSGVSATVESISYEAGSVRVKAVPSSILTGQVLDFIGLDGGVSLSLNVTDSTVETASNTLTWPVSTQPWEDGDKLMVRIRSR